MVIDEKQNRASEFRTIRTRLVELDAERRKLEARLAELERAGDFDEGASMSPAEKVEMFSSLFRGRHDIHAFRWESSAGKNGYALACENEWRPGLCNKPRIKCTDCPHQAFKPLSSHAIYAHLTGKQTIGLYPLLPDNRCFLLAVDFDKSDWRAATEGRARELGFHELYVGTSVPEASERRGGDPEFYLKRGWKLIDSSPYFAGDVAILRRSLW